MHRRILQEVASHSHTISSFPMVAAVGSVSTSVDALPTSRREAMDTLAYLWRRASATSGARGTGPVGSVALFEDHRIPLNILKIHGFIADNALGEGDAVATISAHDRERQTDYLQTLRAYSATNGNVSAMAALLHVHKNTVRYRLARLVDEFRIDLEDPHVRLWLALRVASNELADAVDSAD
jgi:sugar diacid utilization regulator